MLNCICQGTQRPFSITEPYRSQSNDWSLIGFDQLGRDYCPENRVHENSFITIVLYSIVRLVPIFSNRITSSWRERDGLWQNENPSASRSPFDLHPRPTNFSRAPHHLNAWSSLKTESRLGLPIWLFHLKSTSPVEQQGNAKSNLQLIRRCTCELFNHIE